LGVTASPRQRTLPEPIRLTKDGERHATDLSVGNTQKRMPALPISEYLDERHSPSCLGRAGRRKGWGFSLRCPMTTWRWRATACPSDPFAW